MNSHPRPPAEPSTSAPAVSLTVEQQLHIQEVGRLASMKAMEKAAAQALGVHGVTARGEHRKRAMNRRERYIDMLKKHPDYKDLSSRTLMKSGRDTFRQKRQQRLKRKERNWEYNNRNWI